MHLEIANTLETDDFINVLVRFMSRRGRIRTLKSDNGRNFVGVWERQIRLVRKVLNGLLDEQKLTDESLHTFMCQVEAILNSRPLTKVSDDPRDSEI